MARREVALRGGRGAQEAVSPRVHQNSPARVEGTGRIAAGTPCAP